MFRPRNNFIFNVLPIPIRRKHGKDHWSMKAKKTFPKDKALEHFDDFYKSVFGDRWPSIRVALLSQQKYVAVVNNFGDTEKTCTQLENLGGINLRTLYNLEKEKLSKKKKKDVRQNELDKIYKMDQNMESYYMKMQEKEVTSIYGTNASERGTVPESLHSSNDMTNEPHTEENKESSASENNLASQLSLHKKLGDAQFDERRMIDPDAGTGALHEFIPATKLKGMDDWVLESQHYQYYQNPSEFPVRVENDTFFDIPKTYQIYSYERGNVSDFPAPRKSSTGVYTHYLMNGSSILPVLALDLQPGDRVLDACAAPGGKSLIMLQSLVPQIVVSNDVMESRINRIKSVFHQYFYDYETKLKGMSVISQQDARAITDFGSYDKILVDVPCTTDRHSLHNDDNNLFKSSRIKERLRIPELQSQILSNCLRLLRPGGTIVYSTCTLSPVQNDGVVHLALRQAFEQYNIEACVRNISTAVAPFNQMFRFGSKMGLRYGQLVVPFLPTNFGPLYFSKLVRVK